VQCGINKYCCIIVNFNWLSSQWAAKSIQSFRIILLYKDKKYPERMYNLSPKERDNEKANFRRLVKPFNVKNGTLYHGDVEAVTRDRVPGILKFVLGVYKFLRR